MKQRHFFNLKYRRRKVTYGSNKVAILKAVCLIKDDPDAWDILSFWRACDVEQSCELGRGRLKQLTTDQVRMFLASLYDADFIFWPLSSTDMTRRQEELLKAPQHFRQHWTAVVSGIRRVFGFDFETETWIE